MSKSVRMFFYIFVNITLISLLVYIFYSQYSVKNYKNKKAINNLQLSYQKKLKNSAENTMSQELQKKWFGALSIYQIINTNNQMLHQYSVKVVNLKLSEKQHHKNYNIYPAQLQLVTNYKNFLAYLKQLDNLAVIYSLKGIEINKNELTANNSDNLQIQMWIDFFIKTK